MPKAEKKLHDHLNKKGIDVFCPLVTRIVNWSDRKKKVLRPLFPNYVFACISTASEKSLIYDASGFVRFLSTDGKIDIIPDTEIQTIRTLLIASPVVTSDCFEVGEEVEVTQGHFKGLKGTLLRKNGSHKLLVHLNCFKQCLVIEISPTQVTRVSELVLC